MSNDDARVVHIEYVDGTTTSAVGVPFIEGDALVVRVEVGTNPNIVIGETGFPLRIVKNWSWAEDPTALPSWAQKAAQEHDEWLRERGTKS